MSIKNEKYTMNQDTAENPENLSQLVFNQKARVTSVQSKSSEVQCRLLTLGLYPGVDIEVLRRAPMGDPLQVRAGTTLLSIRQHEADGIEVELL